VLVGALLDKLRERKVLAQALSTSIGLRRWEGNAAPAPRRSTDRHVDKEHRTPAKVECQQPAERWSDGEPDRYGGGL
jgi:hypothetical protein